MRKRTKHVTINCNRCYNAHDYHLNDLKAIRSPFFGLTFGLLIALDLFGILLLNYYVDTTVYQWAVISIMAGVPTAACGLLFRQNMFNVTAFNRSFVSD